MADEFKAYRAELVDTDANLYRDSAGQSTYTRDEGLLVIPVMGPAGTPPVVARVHAPYGVRTETFSAAKQDIPPIYPPQADTTSGDVILTSALHFPKPATDLHGHLTFGVAGEYTYVQPLGGRGPDSTYPMGRHPFPTLLDWIDVMPPPATGGAYDDMGWSWNFSSYDARLLCSYDLIG